MARRRHVAAYKALLAAIRDDTDLNPRQRSRLLGEIAVTARAMSREIETFRKSIDATELNARLNREIDDFDRDDD